MMNFMSVSSMICSGRRATASLDNWSLNHLVNLGTNLLDFVFSIKVSLDDLVGLNETIKLSLELSILLSEEFLVSEKGIQVLTEVVISFNKGLVAVFHTLKISSKTFNHEI